MVPRQSGIVSKRGSGIKDSGVCCLRFLGVIRRIHPLEGIRASALLFQFDGPIPLLLAPPMHAPRPVWIPGFSQHERRTLPLDVNVAQCHLHGPSPSSVTGVLTDRNKRTLWSGPCCLCGASRHEAIDGIAVRRWDPQALDLRPEGTVSGRGVIAKRGISVGEVRSRGRVPDLGPHAPHPKP